MRKLWVSLGTIIIGVVIAVVSHYALNISWGNVILSVWNGILGFLTFGIPVWLVFVCFILFEAFHRAMRYFTNRQNNVATRSPNPQVDYRQDVIEGVLWIWDYGYNLTVDPDKFVPHCPTCKGLLEEIQGSRYLHCEHCNRIVTQCQPSYRKMREKVAKEVYRRLRSGEWADSINRSAETESTLTT